jgi:hypothetical protein
MVHVHEHFHFEGDFLHYIFFLPHVMALVRAEKGALSADTLSVENTDEF